jgi:gas vesicle protein
MPEDRNDFIAAFAIGAIVGIGATLLLAPKPSTAKLLMRDMEPAIELARKKGRRFRKDFSKAAGRTRKRARRTLRDWR